jgi:3-methyladenine DNA glycosylase/8-oxoguanine DNA glycosylase
VALIPPLGIVRAYVYGQAVVEAIVRPAGPYILSLSARRAGDATRTFRDGVFSATLEVEGRLERVFARQSPDGRVHVAGDSAEGLERLRFCLAVDDDHSEFLRRFRGDPLLGRSTSHLAGLRPVRVATVAHALLRALCGQLITSREARQIERRIVRAVTPSLDSFHAAPSGEELGELAPAELRRLGLHARRGAALVRICRSLDLERLRDVPTPDVAARLLRERALGPWSLGVVSLEGLGRWDRGLVGDLGLVKLLGALSGRRVGGWETEELLAPYGEWAGLASVYLLTGWARGLVPVPSARAA